MNCKLGIIGTGRIAQRFVSMIRKYFANNVMLCGVYNPNRDSADNFAMNNGIDYCTDNLDEFLNNNLFIEDEVYRKAVYIASPHETHYDYARKALEAGFNVLCEKPITLKQSDAEELFQLANEKGLVLIEGIKTAYCPGYKKIVELVNEGIIGDVIDVEAAFTRIGPTDSREYWDENYGGSFLEFGRYPMLPIYDLLQLMHKNDAMDITFKSVAADTVMDKFTKAIISWKDEDGFEKCMATVKTGLGVKSEGELLISGTKGYIQVPSPWWLTKKIFVRFEDSKKVQEYNLEYEDSGLQYEMYEFLNCIADTEYKSHDKVNQSIWCAGIFEKFYKYINHLTQNRNNEIDSKSIGIWAHRGCSMQYPENTIQSFSEAAKLNGIRGIEFDVQYTKDKQLVVFHDELVNRVTNGTGFVRDYTLAELKQLLIWEREAIPTLREVFDLLKPYCIQNGLLLNIELKTSVYRYEGIEQMTVDMVNEYGLADYIVYSSFLPDSIAEIKRIVPNARTGMLAVNASDCIKFGDTVNADDYHPASVGLDVVFNKANYKEKAIRMWNGSEPLYGSGKVLKEKNLIRFEKLGVTDIFTNVPEMYLKGQV